MKRFKEHGFVGAALAVILAVIGFWFMLCVDYEPSEQVVSGIVYNTTNNGALSGNTKFSVRASTDTYTNESNESTYCLPGNSPYKEIVNEAAADKTVKVVVTTKKFFAIKSSPWTCVDNVVVTREK